MTEPWRIGLVSRPAAESWDRIPTMRHGLLCLTV